jgi:hypothetical protein
MCCVSPAGGRRVSSKGTQNTFYIYSIVREHILSPAGGRRVSARAWAVALLEIGAWGIEALRLAEA